MDADDMQLVVSRLDDADTGYMEPSRPRHVHHDPARSPDRVIIHRREPHPQSREREGGKWAPYASASLPHNRYLSSSADSYDRHADPFRHRQDDMRAGGDRWVPAGPSRYPSMAHDRSRDWDNPPPPPPPIHPRSYHSEEQRSWEPSPDRTSYDRWPSSRDTHVPESSHRRAYDDHGDRHRAEPRSWPGPDYPADHSPRFAKRASWNREPAPQASWNWNHQTEPPALPKIVRGSLVMRSIPLFPLHVPRTS
ncbi:hypothetical protein BS47DRAFT_40122 [Hydnum rufescens UP504]|uniref:Uncharacterized protein n=1 Tax=Hydnum rufescens UP504 TaxID=1448309 RepID=A0A9P6ASY3_9AGAM|nr:hypothetical protein BS47DRAFT_40122 [Hydnum rufescens UP504]